MSAAARRMTRAAEDIANVAMMAATPISGHCVCEAHTPAPAAMTATFTMQSLRVQSQTDILCCRPRGAGRGGGHGEIGGEGKQADGAHQFGFRHRRDERAVDRARRDPETEQTHDAALEQRRGRTAIQREAGNGERHGVIGGVTEKIEASARKLTEPAAKLAAISTTNITILTPRAAHKTRR